MTFFIVGPDGIPAIHIEVVVVLSEPQASHIISFLTVPSDFGVDNHGHFWQFAQQ
jgi:hypothetical protein